MRGFGFTGMDRILGMDRMTVGFRRTVWGSEMSGEGVGLAEGFEVGAGEAAVVDAVVDGGFQAALGVVLAVPVDGQGGDEVGGGAAEGLGGFGGVVAGDGLVGAVEEGLAADLVVDGGSHFGWFLLSFGIGLAAVG